MQVRERERERVKNKRNSEKKREDEMRKVPYFPSL